MNVEKKDDKGDEIVQNISKNYKEYFPKNQKSSQILSNKGTCEDYLIKIRSIIDVNGKSDGLILYYSGHGVKNGIILANGESCSIKQSIINTFNLMANNVFI